MRKGTRISASIVRIGPQCPTADSRMWRSRHGNSQSWHRAVEQAVAALVGSASKKNRD
jgi:hypothetical protein